MKWDELVSFVDELMGGLFSLRVLVLDADLEGLWEDYGEQLPLFLSARQKRQMTSKLTTLPSQEMITHYKDSLMMNYIVFYADPEYIIVFGPFIEQEITKEIAEELMQENHFPISYSLAFYTYYESLPVCRSTELLFVAKTIINKLFHTKSDPIVKEIVLEKADQSLDKDTEQKDYAESIMPLLEKRYEVINQLYLEVQYGNTSKAIEHHLTLKKHLKVIKRNRNPLRNQKNLAFVHNTHLRIASEQASVHPIYLDSISNHYAILIEASTNVSELEQLGIEMIKEYCRLVKKYSLRIFSPLVRKVVNYIQLHLSDELTLDQLATYTGVSTSHLSRTFNKEVHESIPNYINHARADKAAQMLEFSQHSVQEVGEYVGFYDLNYFTKVFKKYYYMPPAHYQKKHSYY
ncbi:AraC family transcriptional regulator [Gracilibacillus kekensis]|uniref:AraC-type DNA-binding protein n=1 Tax=Gracilibacillus kekensis TaxID=1027249 RepID=A0A1M7JSW3_9BACI|nr:AraC family transcriptional regulator [Gracilibacillus kekensis]SHM56106.1 AraC-type DNA-binding protein [Gracilibacillus kekensis]